MLFRKLNQLNQIWIRAIQGLSWIDINNEILINNISIQLYN